MFASMRVLACKQPWRWLHCECINGSDYRKLGTITRELGCFRNKTGPPYTRGSMPIRPPLPGDVQPLRPPLSGDLPAPANVQACMSLSSTFRPLCPLFHFPFQEVGKREGAVEASEWPVGHPPPQHPNLLPEWTLSISLSCGLASPASQSLSKGCPVLETESCSRAIFGFFHLVR